MANDALITSELYPLLVASKQELPEDVTTFLTEVHRRNTTRNVSLFATLKDALAALNAVGIEPVLLKGCGTWAVNDGATLQPNGDRMVSDLDLLVLPTEARLASDSLKQAQFLVLQEHDTGGHHACADLGRPQDAGAIDLHFRTPGPVGIHELDNLHAHSRAVYVGGQTARVPSRALQILVATLHDLVEEGLLWRGGFHLRHLMDITKSVNEDMDFDWPELVRLCPTHFLRGVLKTQLIAAREITGARVPDSMLGNPLDWIQYYRLRMQFEVPAFQATLRALGQPLNWRGLPQRTRVS